MEMIFLAKRIVNDVKPLLDKGGRIPDTILFMALCLLFYEKRINNQQFKGYLKELMS